ncbi:hypothetical protein DH2020_015148 [Rehmannia glutinosa]|uniref:Reverse transcriptase n=1 Tax=Rehmannia glutinosa TaxID=99300 RepID=A0ABR0WYG9_REHGL
MDDSGNWCDSEQGIRAIQQILPRLIYVGRGLRGTYYNIPETLTVNELINAANGQWDTEKINQIFEREDADDILALHLSIRLPADKRIWVHTKSGDFSVRSCYYLIKSTLSNSDTAKPSTSFKNTAWRRMWELRLLPRIKHFLWRACTDTLPTKSNLIRRGILMDTICHLCGEDIETLSHLFTQCETIKRIWYLSPLRMDLQNNAFGSFRNLFWSLLSTHPIEFVELFAFLAWSIWSARNKLYMDQVAFQSQLVIIDGQKLFLEMHQVGQKLEKKERVARDIKWKPPNENSLKMNTDAATFDDGSVGFGFVIRNATGEVILAGASRSNKTGSSTYIEGLAMIFALTRTVETGLSNIHIESDSKCLVDGIHGKPLADIQGDIIIEDILALARQANILSFSHVHREANKLAHALAHCIQDRNSEIIWRNEVPNRVEHIRLSDVHNYSS